MFGYIYVLRLLDSEYMFTTPTRRGCSYKIGKAKDHIIRTKTLGILLPYPSEVMLMIPTCDMGWVERYIHEKLAHLRINGEWFALTQPLMEWLTVLGSPYFVDTCRENQEEMDGSFSFYADPLNRSPG